ncbi:MAG: tRNA(Ile)(2)-agmatinylcytidine synthase [archaeon]|nr:tRNA(Ile)(2)-agmatinylcytidine synthase [archaeon]
MFIAVDDTDSVKGNCTTFLATEIIRELSDFDLIGNPRLIRLNPAVPWKTRGNGSLVIELGKGIGEKKCVGMFNDKKVYCYNSVVGDEPDHQKIMDRIAPLVQKYHEDDSNPGLLISSKRPDISFYKRGVTTIMSREEINSEIKKIGATIFTIGNGRGLIGALCGLAWIPTDSTFELLAYRERNKWGTARYFDPLSVEKMDCDFPTTFNSWENKRKKAVIFPATPCPVLYGLRGDVEKDVIDAANMLKTEKRDRWFVFLTNQGTDDHVIYNADIIASNQSYFISGTVVSKAEHIKGGHVFTTIRTKYGIIVCGTYEPSKEFRLVFDQLIPGDVIEVVGEYRDFPKTLNVEKLHVVSTVDYIEKISNPICPFCNKKMNSIGEKQGYRCKKCHVKTKDAIFRKKMRWIVPGWYEPPTCARRHLSKPLKRMGMEQPIEFVNRRYV